MEQLTSATLSPVVGTDACVLSYSLLKNQAGILLIGAKLNSSTPFSIIR
ncbi:hypothetical protein SAMN02927900_03090 [Rhizobium mongolense subsp. loessense]|uniref:Uncharacterized protein n=1 Tax=Rhizobium mongolense subsp. loessense TaxID=158890 RepID=A0A1G4RXA0_9HYPH|nr:hypothetical protein [Rhizobium mongolense]SCW61105.1 hypothetical protein SAMN02927900_03090 [Rhizobium mongolense subsp. loessense]